MARSALAAVLLLAALLLPDRPAGLDPTAALRLPVEVLLGAALVLLLPRRTARGIAAAAGALLGVLVVGNLLDLGFWTVLSRRFDPLLDGPLLGDAVQFVSTSVGRPGALAAALAVGLLAVGTVAALAWSAARVVDPLRRRRPQAVPAIAALATVWVTCAALGATTASGEPLAADPALRGAVGRVEQARDVVRDRHEFTRESGVDPFGATPGDRLLTALRGKDVTIAFVESYGRSALESPRTGPGVRSVLATQERRLQAAGFAGRSAFLTSPTSGGSSWLAHSTMMSGLWIDNQQRYRTLIAGDRLTLPGAFHRAGWRTVGMMPGVTRAWPEGGFYDLDTVYDSRTLGYRGPAFGWARIPDQYTLAVLGRRELSRPGRGPLLTWIPLVSSHAPWAPTPPVVGWDDVGDGSVLRSWTAPADRQDDGWPDPGRVQDDYGRSVQYSLTALLSFVATHGDDRTVLIVLGDHQPAPVVTGPGASHDVPVTVVARDPHVLAQISTWDWQPGLTPSADAPVWRMDTFRTRFLTTFSPPPPTPR